jgi:chromosome partitioning protein
MQAKTKNIKEKGAETMSKIIAIGNQKGGVGKTTTSLNLGTALALKGEKVLLIDLDPQANLSAYLGFECDGKPTISEALAYAAGAGQNKVTANECIRNSEKNRVDYIPANINLASADFYLLAALSKETVLKRLLTTDITEKYSYILIDCLPSLGVLLTNALTASNELLIPVQTQKFALDGMQMLMQIYNDVKNSLNPALKICGVLPTMVENTTMSKSTLVKLQEQYKKDVFNTVIHKSTEAANSSESGKSLCLRNCKLGDEYKALALEVLERGGKHE